MSQREVVELEIVKRKNFLMQYFYASYKSNNDPKNSDPVPYGGWIFLVVDTIAFCVCIFAMYFIIGFGIRYGPETAELWLIQFISSILTTFCICDPLVIFIKCAIIPQQSINSFYRIQICFLSALLVQALLRLWVLLLVYLVRLDKLL